MSRLAPHFAITPDILLRAYSIGLFPMAEGRDDSALFWVDPKERGIFPLEKLRISHRLARLVRSDYFDVRANVDFDAIVAACANRDKTWINAEIRRLYRDLFDSGHAHCVGAYLSDKLVGGLYGVSLGAAFFGESMFHAARDASKVALVHLVARLRKGGFTLLDTQFLTPHLARLGAVEIARADYLKRLDKAIAMPAEFAAWAADRPMRGEVALAICAGDLNF